MADFEIDIIRHGEHKGVCVIPELTDKGVSEAKIMGNIIKANGFDNYVAHVINRPRFIGTAALVLYPDMDIEVVEVASKKLIEEGKILIDDELDYKPMTDKRFKIDMSAAFNCSRAMEYIVNKSSSYSLNGDLSTYKTMSGLMARKILSTTRSTIFCSRELMPSSFRAKITAMRLGDRALRDYVSWYMENEERNHEARTHITQIQTNGNDYLLKDWYGEIDFSKQTLTTI